jgi:hypothetical protein
MNKYFYLLAAGLLTLSVARAQIKKGDVLLDVGLGFSKQDPSPVTVNNGQSKGISVFPSFGKAVRDNLVVGVNLAYFHSRTSNLDGIDPLYTLNYNIYGFAFYVRRYKNLGHGFSIFSEGDLVWSHNDQKGVYEGAAAPRVDEKSFSVGASLSGGIAYNITPRWQLETRFRNLASVGYGHAKDDGTNAGGRKTNSYSLGSILRNPVDNIVVDCIFIL